MNGKDKLMALVGGRPVLAHCLGALVECGRIDAIQLVASRANFQDVQAMAAPIVLGKPLALCLGGPTRAHSVLCGLRAASGGGFDWAVVHDGARPFLTPAMVACGLAAAAGVGAAIAAVAATDTVKICDAAGRIISTPPRERVWLAQTPQIARFAALLRAHETQEHRLSEFTDEASILEESGYPVTIFEGSQANIKITDVDDLTRAEQIYRACLLGQLA